MSLLPPGHHNHDDRDVDDINILFFIYSLLIFYSSCMLLLSPGQHNHDDRGVGDDYSYYESDRSDDNSGEDVR